MFIFLLPTGKSMLHSTWHWVLGQRWHLSDPHKIGFSSLFSSKCLKELVHELACKWHYFCWIKCEHFITWYIKKVILDPCIMYFYLLLSKQRFEHVFYSIWDCISPLLVLIVLWTIIHKYLWSLKGVIQRMM